MNNKKEKFLLVLLGIFLVVGIVALSYAAFRFNSLGKKGNVITLGTLKLTLDEGETVNLDSVYPLSDADSLTLDGYSFTLKNTGTADVSYKIYLEDLAVNSPDIKLADKYIRLSVAKDGVVGSIKDLSKLNDRVIEQGIIKSGVNNKYVLRIWPSIDVDGDITGHVYKGKIKITGEQVK